MLFVPVKMTSHVPRSVVRFRASDNRRIPVAVSQVVATSADDAMVKLKRLVGAGSWPPYAEAVRLFEDGVEIDSFVLELHQERAA